VRRRPQLVASESRLVAAHVVYTLAWLLVLLGFPGLYAAQRGGMGRLGLVGFLTAFSGTYVIAVTGNFGFLAPVLAKEAAGVLDAIAQYWPVPVINGLAAIAFMIGYLMFGVAMTKTALPRWSGVFVVVGAPAHLLGLGISLLVSTAAWPVAILGSVSLGARSRLARLSNVARTGCFGFASLKQLDRSMSSGSSENPGVHPPSTAHRARVIIFRVVAALAGLFFVVAVVLMASAPWVLLQPDQETRTELNRWFLTVAGSVDAIAAGVLLALAQRPGHC
jgi:hypothetical protein